MKDKLLKWEARWSDGYPDRAEVITSTFFHGMGYETEDVGRAIQLEIGETLDLSDMSGTHTLTRIQ